jgi:DNA polymerase III delta prime subunit
MKSNEIEDILMKIIKKENILIDDKDIHNLIKDDLRRSINNLQKLIFLNRNNKIDNKIQLKYFDDEVKININEIIYNDNLDTIEYTNYIINEGYSFEELYNVLKKELLSNNDIDDNDKAKIFMEMCRSYNKIINGSSELININHILNIINKS